MVLVDKDTQKVYHTVRYYTAFCCTTNKMLIVLVFSVEKMLLIFYVGRILRRQSVLRNKSKYPLRLEGKNVVLEEVQPKYFPYVIEWRNTPELNQFLNQPFKLTMENQTKWYEEKYLLDDTQGFMLILDKDRGTPFATMGWVNLDVEKKMCIMGRLILGNSDYARHPGFFESFFVLADYLYEMVDVMYIHIVKENSKSIHINKLIGYIPNDGQIQYPEELFVNGMEQQEFYRTKERYLDVRKKIFERLSVYR